MQRGKHYDKSVEMKVSGRKCMRFYRDREKKILEKVVCNACGRSLQLEGHFVSEGVLHVRKDWDYFSEKDLIRHEFDLCESCYDKMIAEFRVPVTEGEILEI
jgi:hypothetical protein